MKPPSYEQCQQQTPVAPFPHYDEKYMCCCRCTHVKSGARVIGGVTLFFIVMSLFRSMTSGKDAAFTCTILAAEIICTIYLFIGINKTRPGYLWPFIVFFILSLFGTLLLLLVALYAYADPSAMSAFVNPMTSPSSYHDERSMRAAALFLSFLLAIGFGVTAWWLHVIYKCYKYLVDLKQYQRQFEQNVAFFPN